MKWVVILGDGYQWALPWECTLHVAHHYFSEKYRNLWFIGVDPISLFYINQDPYYKWNTPPPPPPLSHTHTHTQLPDLHVFWETNFSQRSRPWDWACVKIRQSVILVFPQFQFPSPDIMHNWEIINIDVAIYPQAACLLRPESTNNCVSKLTMIMFNLWVRPFNTRFNGKMLI